MVGLILFIYLFVSLQRLRKILEKAMHEGTFNEELYYVLNRISIQIAPLRSRKKDIPSIVGHLLVKLNQEFGMNIEKITMKHKIGLSNMIGQEM